METLLERTRSINRAVNKKEGRISFDEIAKVLCGLIGSNTYLADTEGNILGHALVEEFDCDYMAEVVKERKLPEEYNGRLMRYSETLANKTREKQRFCAIKRDLPCLYEHRLSTIVPIFGAGQRLGTLVLARYEGEFDENDLIVCEYAATVIGMEIMRQMSEKREEETRKRTAVQVALNTLSYSELEAIEHIFEELNGKEGLLVASKIADRVGITRSVIVNALRKFESAGIIESRSLGMKGTHIKVLNDCLMPELERMRS